MQARSDSSVGTQLPLFPAAPALPPLTVCKLGKKTLKVATSELAAAGTGLLPARHCHAGAWNMCSGFRAKGLGSKI